MGIRKERAADCIDEKYDMDCKIHENKKRSSVSYICYDTREKK